MATNNKQTPTTDKQRLTKTRLTAALSRSKRHVLQNVNHNSPEMRRLTDLLHLHISDMGGPDNVSHAERVLIGRASMLTLLAEMTEAAFATKTLKASASEQWSNTSAR